MIGTIFLAHEIELSNSDNGVLPAFPENFMQIRSEVFAQSC